MYSQLDSNVHEHLLSAITVLIDDNPAAIQQAKGMKNFNFKQISRFFRSLYLFLS